MISLEFHLNQFHKGDFRLPVSDTFYFSGNVSRRGGKLGSRRSRRTRALSGDNRKQRPRNARFCGPADPSLDLVCDLEMNK